MHPSTWLPKLRGYFQTTGLLRHAALWMDSPVRQWAGQDFLGSGLTNFATPTRFQDFLVSEFKGAFLVAGEYLPTCLPCYPRSWVPELEVSIARAQLAANDSRFRLSSAFARSRMRFQPFIHV